MLKLRRKTCLSLLRVYSLRNLVKLKTCFNPSCIDHILTNSTQSFQNSNVFETGLSDFHKLTTTVLKQYFPNLTPKVVNYRDYHKFGNDEFRAQLDNEILKHDINNMEYQQFLNIFTDILNKHAPMKERYLRVNQGRFTTRSRLRTKFLSDRTEIQKITKFLRKPPEKSQKRIFCKSWCKFSEGNKTKNLVTIL